MTDEAITGASIETLADPETLRDTPGVAVETVERTLDDETFEGLRRFHADIAGVVQVGLTTADGRLLLEGSTTEGGWAPPGGPVRPDSDWVAAARETMEAQTGAAIEIDRVLLYEELSFQQAGIPDRSFTSTGVSFAASLADPEADADFLETPRIVDHPHLPADHDRTFAWFDGVPTDAHPNHIDHIELFLE